jgi:hypothetical protein
MPPSSLPTRQLVAVALIEVEEDHEDEPAPHLVALHDRANRDVLDIAIQLLSHDNRIRRELGARILRELGPADPDADGRRPFSAEAVPALRLQLARETDPRVLGWLISALGYNSAVEALDDVLALTAHQHPRVRFHVAAALPSLVSPERVDDAAVAALQQLSHDEDADIRWYAFYAMAAELPGIDPYLVRHTASTLITDPDDQIRELARTHNGGPPSDAPT